ncbi:origin recognition complex subunit 5 isoform X1 [Rhopalosiphum padi]|uniref:origin recognition complex subunit 5 isoform X1 n=2 Tax=Rhopalosiphum padi TaxID=40932 RepID=UPI00298E3B29|nr:origin recognition complex subunit 5 isoform X1 [Rhopalosiphum padi]
MSSKSKHISIKDTLNSEFPFRQVQINMLSNLFLTEDGVLPPCVFMHGLPSTGKTSVATRLLNLLGKSVKSSIVNSVCCYTNQFLFEPILKDLLQIKQSDLPNRCDNFMQFLNILKQSEIQQERVIILLDNCEMLGHEQIVLFSKLQELIKSYQLCVILISQVPPAKFDEDINFLPIVFEQYNTDEISVILSKDIPNDWSLSIYQNFLTVFMGSFYGSCRDLVELKYLAKLLFIKYVEPIEDGSCTEMNRPLLFRKISPSIQLLLNNVYLGTSLENVNSLSDEKTKFEKLALDLPYYAKYFLIAAYIASFNLPKYDKQLFVKASNKKRKTNRLVNKTENSTCQLVGPKVFSLDRLLAIFYAIIEENTNMTANLLAQVNTLSDLGLLIRLGDGKLDTPKYRCSVSFDCVSNIARTVKFNLNKYLIDK